MRKSCFRSLRSHRQAGLRGQSNAVQDAQKGRLSHPPDPGAPRRASPRPRVHRAKRRGGTYRTLCEPAAHRAKPSVLTPLEKSASGFRVSSALRVNRSPSGWIVASGEAHSALSLLALDPLHQERKSNGAPDKAGRLFQRPAKGNTVCVPSGRRLSTTVIVEE